MKNILFLMLLASTSDLFGCEQSSDFHIGLLGSIVTLGGKKSGIENSALIKLKNNKASWFYEGDILQSDYVLNKVNRDYILVKNVNKHFKIYLNSCEKHVETDNANLYLAITDTKNPPETITEIELAPQQQRIFIKTLTISNDQTPVFIQEQGNLIELKKDQARVFYKLEDSEIVQ